MVWTQAFQIAVAMLLLLLRVQAAVVEAVVACEAWSVVFVVVSVAVDADAAVAILELFVEDRPLVAADSAAADSFSVVDHAAVTRLGVFEAKLSS